MESKKGEVVHLEDPGGWAQSVEKLLAEGLIEVVIRPTKAARSRGSVLGKKLRNWADRYIRKADNCYVDTETLRQHFNRVTGMEVSSSQFGRTLADVFNEMGYDHKRLSGNGRSTYLDITIIENSKGCE